MTGKHLKGTGHIDTPDAARELYRRDPVVIPWDDEKDALVSRQFRKLKDLWQFDPKPDGNWKSPEYRVVGDRVIAQGNCNDFAPTLKAALIVAGLPEQALRLVICDYDGNRHMVLAVETDQGSLICCNIVGCWALGRPALRHHDWIAWEAPGRPWESLEPIELTDLLERTKHVHEV
ncbi:transglutaminase-like cysteine peptidase [Pelagibius litoralis]|uniref:Transglutaminase-like cysteine peptidase n=1 Tax=Pelagibius litoralis TaxID=374515 RepID=A0A967EUV5_9PROT|nr:transglutaminase-like cysteine peptidase [Pelagibius litoralis]NIA67761.1 transglutaminase-like cysteine peptidase [Pelagibius litoralis]